jgi:hypothetical protein
MAGVLIFSDISDTPWSDSKFVSVPNYPYYQLNSSAFLPTCQMTKSLVNFAKSMYILSQDEDFEIEYDYAVAVMKYFNYILFH